MSSFPFPGARRRAAHLAWPLLLALALTACAGAATPPPSATATLPSLGLPPTATPAGPTDTPAPAFPVTLIDDEGTSVAIPAAPQRIVSLTPAATETLFAIGAGDRVAAKVEDITPYPPAADALPVVATYQGVDVEQIVALKADLVIAGGLGFTPPAAVAQLRSLGIPVIVLYAESVDEALAGIDAVGVATGDAEAAAQMTAAMRVEIDALGSQTAGLDHPVTLYEVSYYNGIYTVPANSLYAEMLGLAGADPITTDSSYQISLEKLVAADPTVILLGDGEFAKPEDLAARPGWSGIKAVVDGRIVVVNDTLITRPGPRLLEGLRELIKALHPEVLI